MQQSYDSSRLVLKSQQHQTECLNSALEKAHLKLMVPYITYKLKFYFLYIIIIIEEIVKRNELLMPNKPFLSQNTTILVQIANVSIRSYHSKWFKSNFQEYDLLPIFKTNLFQVTDKPYCDKLDSTMTSKNQ